MFNVRLAAGHLYGKWLFTWLSLVISLRVSNFVLSFFSHEMSWVRSGTELSLFLRIFLPTLPHPIQVKAEETEFYDMFKSPYIGFLKFIENRILTLSCKPFV